MIRFCLNMNLQSQKNSASRYLGIVSNSFNPACFTWAIEVPDKTDLTIVEAWLMDISSSALEACNILRFKSHNPQVFFSPMPLISKET